MPEPSLKEFMSILCDNCGKSESGHYCYVDGGDGSTFQPPERREHLPPETWADQGCVKRHGVKVSNALFTYFADSANVGTNFRFDRNDDGNITVTRLEPGSAIAIEYGYRACEKGQSLQQALDVSIIPTPKASQL